MDQEELMFFDRWPGLLPIYVRLREMLTACYPQMTVRVTKTQISFRSRYIFAMVSLPDRRPRGWPREYLLVSFGLGEKRESPRIRQSVEPYPGRWTHHVPVEGVEEIDGELMGWLDEAFQFSNNK